MKELFLAEKRGVNFGLIEACVVACPFALFAISVRLFPVLSESGWQFRATRWLALVALVSFIAYALIEDLVWMRHLGTSVNSSLGEQVRRYVSLFGYGTFFAIAGYPLAMPVVSHALSSDERRAAFWRMLVVGWAGVIGLGFLALRLAR